MQKHRCVCSKGKIALFSLLFLIVLLTGSGCHSTKAYRSESEIFGKWKSQPYVSQMGKAISYYSFNNDGTFSQKMSLLDANFEMVEKGTFFTKNNYIYFEIRNKTRKEQYILKEDVLTIFDGPKTRIDMYRE